MKKKKVKASTVVADILDIAVTDHKKFEDLLEKFVEVKNYINGVFNSDLDERIKVIISKNPNNKNIQSLLNLTQNINQKHKLDHQSRIIFATETIKQFKPAYGLDLRNEFEIVDGRFRWKKDIQDIL